ncbi:MAG: beta-ketoacyl-[acyl-carrier-protein] synthase family protein [Candidatus Schekmanbacteria bacterium]|nr:beta-ketoacyl-[acyl-carrier-protein] synthase family protein [Candidatus Schekmanbacteria bacterium]
MNRNSGNRRAPVLVTGIGVVAPGAVGREAFWARILDARPQTRPVTLFDTSRFRSVLGGEVPREDLALALDDFAARTHAAVPAGRTARLLLVAADEALASAGLGDAELRRATAFVFGSTLPEDAFEQHALRRFACQQQGVPFAAPEPAEMFAAAYAGGARAVGRALGLSDVRLGVPGACAAGNYALLLGALLIRDGAAERVLCCGADHLSPVNFAGFGQLGLLADDVCRPFDACRRGLIPAEGAGALLLESRSSAAARGATVLAELRGAGMATDAYHVSAPDPSGRGLTLAIERALGDAEASGDAIDYVSAHGTGTPANDRVESLALRRVFGSRLDHLPVSSIKSIFGHSMGAASAIEAVATVQAIRAGVLPPTINHVTPDPDCVPDVVPNAPRPARVKLALSNGYAFGGGAVAIILAAATGEVAR